MVDNRSIKRDIAIGKSILDKGIRVDKTMTEPDKGYLPAADMALMCVGIPWEYL